MTTFHITEANGYGDAPLKAGDIVRMNNGSPFMDCLILGFSSDGYTRLARPYAYASCVGTTGPTALTGVEIFTTETRRIGDGSDTIIRSEFITR